jgi:predicted nucleic acid-binding protein
VPDAFYVALAEAVGEALVTADLRLARSAQAAGVGVIALAPGAR